jgi:predicted PurR-regulated permease PerM
MIALTGAVLLGLVLCYFIALPFLPALVWSLTLAVLSAPLERWLRERVGLPSLSVTLTIALVAAVVVAPVVLVASALLTEQVASMGSIIDLTSAQHWQELGRRHHWLRPVVNWMTTHLEIEQVLQSFATRLGDWSTSVVQGSVATVGTLLLTFYFLFFLLRDRERIVAAMRRTFPLSEAEFGTLMDGLVRTIFASVYGPVAVAALQGVLSGLMFWWLGLPSPVFWGVVMGLLAIVPFLGAFVVWLPVAIGLALNGQLLSAAILTIWGTVVVGLIDNIVYPILVGRQLAMHSMLSFIAIVGGLILFGAYGIVLGPMIVAGSLILVEIWRSRLDTALSPAPRPEGVPA